MELVVAYSSDNNYYRHLLVSIISLIENNKKFDSIKIYIIDNGILQENKETISKWVKKYDAKVVFYSFSKIISKLITDNQYSLSSYGRLFLDDVVEEDKVLYLDCDSVVCGDFYELWTTDMEDNICFGVQDNVTAYYKKSIGLDKNDVYINAGVLLIDLSKWRGFKLQDAAVDMIRKYNGSVPHHDQGVINAICHGKIKRIHPKYNFQCPMFEYTPKELSQLVPQYYCEKELREAFDNPVFVHFTEGYSNRPWRKKSTHPFKEEYRKYQAYTEFKDQYEDRELNSNAKKMLWLYRHLPFFMYRMVIWVNEIRKSAIRRMNIL